MRGRGKNLKSRLTESELIYHSIFSNSFDGILLTAPDGKILAANPAACRMFGRSEEEMCRLGRTGVMNINDPRLESALDQRELTGEFAGELTGVRSDGTVFPVELTTSVFTNSSGEQRTSMIIRDISFRKTMHDELEAREASIRSVVENTDNCIWSVDCNSRFLGGNSAFQARFHRRTGRRIRPGDDVIEWMPEELREKWKRYISRGLSGTSFTTMSSSGAGDDRRYIRYSFNPVINPEGRVTGLTVMGTDVTDLMQMQKKLVKTGVQLKEAQSVARIGNWEYDVRQDKADWSDELLRMFGLQRMPGKQSWESHIRRIHPEDVPMFQEAVMRAFSEGVPFTMVFRLQVPGEEMRWINAICKTEMDSFGHVTRLFGTVQDLTERKMYEDALEKSEETLRRLNMHIEEARENERKQIAMNLHDDLGQKLTALRMNLSWLRKRIGVQSSLVTGKLDEVQQIIESSVATVQRISSDLRPALLHELGLKDAVEWHMKQNLEPAGIRGSFRMTPADPDINEKDSIVLFRIIQEALTNIVRHSGADRAEVRLSGLSSYLKLVIKDNGKGIDAAAVNDPKSFGLTGIRERVKNFSGFFTITGEGGKGTTLTVKIPLNKT